LDSLPVPSVNLEQFYRFALLLGGDAKTAEQVLAVSLAEMQKQEGAIAEHEEPSRLAGGPNPGGERGRQSERPDGGAGTDPDGGRGDEVPQLLAIEAYLFARRFSRLAEPGRSALALLYLDLYQPGELPALLGLSWERLCEVLSSAREELQASLQQMRSAELVTS